MADLNVSKKMALMAVDALEDRKGEDVRVIDISEISTLCLLYTSPSPRD